MICLTGDLHHMSLKTGNQAACDITEVQVARRYLKLLAERDINVTFFVSGRVFAQETADIMPIAEHPLVEIGGHNYTCFQPELPHRVWKKLRGSYHGPNWAQKADALYTMYTIQRHTGKRIRCWRNHMYMHDRDTEQVLFECGFHAVSDRVKRDLGPNRHASGILEVPINVIPDHEHLYHAERTVEWVDQWRRRYKWTDDFGPESYYIDEWTDLVIDGLKRNHRQSLVSTLIIHPITMYLCDRFDGVKRILDYVAEHETVHMGDLYA